MPAQSLSEEATPSAVAPLVTLRYGTGPGELGLIRLPELPPVGPESFALANDGSVLIADAANERISVFSPDGTYRRTLAVPGLALGDVIVDAQGRVFAYDQMRRTLHQFDADGTPRAELPLNPNDIDTRGYFHVVGDAVYFADAAARDVLVAVLRDGALAPPAPDRPRRVEGVHGASGRVYALAVERGVAFRLTVREPETDAPAQSRQVPVPGLLSARFVGEDAARRFYVQVETLEAGGVALGVIAFTPEGRLVRTLRLPENDYALWTARLLDVQPDGTLVQFLPQREQAKLYRFVN
jgi:sugar lactone lactonase YvrE